MIFDEIKDAHIQALKDHDKTARTILTVVYGKIKLQSVDKLLKGLSLPDGDCLSIISKTIKELDEEILAFQSVSRAEKVEELKAQKQVLLKFLPKMMSENEIREEIAKLDDKSIPSVMKYFKVNFNGLCDMSLVNKIAKE